MNVSPTSVLLLNRDAVSEVLTLDDCIAAVEAAFLAHAQGRSLAPGILHIDAVGGEFHVKAGGMHGKRGYFACKINGGFFENRLRFGLPNIIGLIVLSDAATGVPLAVMESGIVTRFRTAAATAVAARYLARPASETVTICGTGAQAEIQLRSLAHVLPLKQVFVWGRQNVGAFAERVGAELGIEVRATTDLITATRQSDVIVTCTPSRSWFLGREHVASGTFVAAVGADSPDKQEIEPELLAAASVVCDLVGQCLQCGDLHHAVAGGLMTTADIRGELGAVIAGSAPGRMHEDENIIFDSTGTALQDAAAAAVVYERAIASGGGYLFPFFSNK